jgi:hypothetical protein
MYGKQNDAEKKDNNNDDDNDDELTPKTLLRDIRILTAPGLHRVLPRLKQVFVNVGGADKLSLLVDVVAGGERQKRDMQDDGVPYAPQLQGWIQILQEHLK